MFRAENYMDELGVEFEKLRKQKVTENEVKTYIELLLSIEDKVSKVQEKNVMKQREDILERYNYAPDLRGLGHNAFRFINAVSDFATHAEPLRRTANYNENMFAKTIDGNPMIDRAYQMIRAAA